ncbi:MAG: FAD binding domain-containing protein [Bacteroidales bacterium]|jgi:xanthine dehydrogenase small subunit|nr:FAD binding domain-containing protein [Bacteroidales bacterium]
MITFLLNNRTIHTNQHPGTSLLDFIRYEMHLPGTKVGCREGDCGACTVLEGTLTDGKMNYQSIVSCLTPLGNAHGKHIVTIEGINLKDLSPIQETVVNQSATQCGFCTPGFIMSFTGHGLSHEQSTYDKTLLSVSGNICRCTGYKSIEKAAKDIHMLLQEKDMDDPVRWMVKHHFLPDYFLDIVDRLKEIPPQNNLSNESIIAGGTDLMVQKPEEIAQTQRAYFYHRRDLKGIQEEQDKISIGAATSATEIMQSSIIQKYIPEVVHYFKLISSEQIRNMGTIAGNFVNASPIGDLSIIFLALNASVVLHKENQKRVVPLKDFFLGYKKIDMQEKEYIETISIPIPPTDFNYNYEKVSKRTHLDIASVNSAVYLRLNNETIEECHISAGGVSPVPLYLRETSVYLMGKKITNAILTKANDIMQKEISPISDIRGSEDYKRLLIRQLLFAHFIKWFPNTISLNVLLS